MKALIVADDERAIANISEVLKIAGYDTIIYRWMLKALDNIEEIAPHLIVVSTRDYPRHWKTLAQYSCAGFGDYIPEMILYADESFPEDELKKAEQLHVRGIFYSVEVEGLDKLREILAKKPDIFSGYLTDPEQPEINVSDLIPEFNKKKESRSEEDDEVPTINSIMSEESNDEEIEAVAEDADAETEETDAGIEDADAESERADTGIEDADTRIDEVNAEIEGSDAEIEESHAEDFVPEIENQEEQLQEPLIEETSELNDTDEDLTEKPSLQENDSQETFEGGIDQDSNTDETLQMETSPSQPQEDELKGQEAETSDEEHELSEGISNEEMSTLFASDFSEGNTEQISEENSFSEKLDDIDSSDDNKESSEGENNMSDEKSIEDKLAEIMSANKSELKEKSSDSPLISCHFVFTNPVTLAMVTGTARAYNGMTLEFSPDIEQFIDNLGPGTQIDTASIKIDGKIEDVHAEVMSNDGNKLFIQIKK